MDRNRAHEYVNQILYSEEMKELHGIGSPHRGFMESGEAARMVQRMVGYGALNRGLNDGYCELLALLYFFDSDTFSFVSVEPGLLDDLMELKSGAWRRRIGSKEVLCVGMVMDTVFEIRGLEPEELERLGGFSIAVCKAVDELSVL